MNAKAKKQYIKEINISKDYHELKLVSLYNDCMEKVKNKKKRITPTHHLASQQRHQHINHLHHYSYMPRYS